ncbi:hypothetical protein NIES4074_28660 [Cylindrospermum sp. NIES-4074]|nr:hypothetical protein NIES4074_28660 [Cylindrospermum sp. NIES-4074]
MLELSLRIKDPEPLKMLPPPNGAELSARVLLLTVAVTKLAIAPPRSDAELPERVLLLTVSVPTLL